MATQNVIDEELWSACEKNDVNKVKALLLCGGNPCHVIEGKGAAAVHWAVWYDHDSTQVLEAIISSGRMKDINVKSTPNDVTPLLKACIKGNVRCAKLLVEKGADVTAVDKSGNGIIHYATYSGKLSMVEKCLKWNRVNVNLPGWKNKTALIMACEKVQVDIVRVLLSAGVDAELKDDDGYPALWYARNNKEITRPILKYQEKQKKSKVPTKQSKSLDDQSASSRTATNQNIASLQIIMKKVFPDFTDEKTKSILVAIQKTGHDFERTNSNLLLLEPSDFENVLKPLEIRMLLNAFKEEFVAEKHNIGNF